MLVETPPRENIKIGGGGGKQPDSGYRQTASEPRVPRIGYTATARKNG